MILIHQSLRAARRDADFLLDTEEFYRQAEGDPRLARWPFTRSAWFDYHPQAARSTGTEVGRRRAFERWKPIAREKGLVELADDEAVYYLELTQLDALLDAALAKRAMVEEQYQKITGRKPRRKRTMNLTEAARVLDVARSRIWTWIAKHRAPASKIKYRRNPGWRYVVNISELEEWLREKAPSRKVRIGPAIPTRDDIESALADSGRTVPSAHALLAERGFYVGRSNLYVLVNKYQLRYYTRSVVEPTDAEIINAMTRSDDRFMGAARKLGLNARTLTNIIERRGLRSRFRIRSNAFEITIEDLAKAMDNHGYHVMMTADHLGISDTCLRKILRQHNLWDRYAELRKRAKTMETAT